MTSRLQQAINLVQLLSQAEQLELLQALSDIVEKSYSLEAQNKQFWTAHSINELIQEQQPPMISDLGSLGMDFWESDESTEAFLAFLHQQRKIEPIGTL